MHIRLSVVAEGVDRKQALSWWWDFQEGGHDHAFLRVPTERQVRQVAEGERYVTERVKALGVPLFTERFLAQLDGYAVRFEGENTWASFQGAYSFQRAEGGTRIELGADVRLRPLVAWSDRLAKPLVEQILVRDLEGHVEAMMGELA